MKLLVFGILLMEATAAPNQKPSQISTSAEDNYGGISVRWADKNINGSAALDNFPLIDGHNDLPGVIKKIFKNQLKKYDFKSNVTVNPAFSCPGCQHVDFPKLKAGKVGAQFWSAYVSCDTQYKDAIAHALEQIDLIKRLVVKYSDDLQFVKTADGIENAFKKKKIGSLIGLEGGHMIQYRLSVLRAYYELGVRYLTLTHECNTPWADSSPLDINYSVNLTKFGEKVILEMNRLGMMVDLAHVSYNTMKAALKVSLAPVIFSHSSSHAIFPHPRNVRDAILEMLKENKGIIMVNFYTHYVGDNNATIHTVIEHINHIVDVCGIRCVGIGSDYDGVKAVPKGLEDVSTYPRLFDLLKELNPKRWTIRNLEKLAGRNLVRVFKDVEKVSRSLAYLEPVEDWIPDKDLLAVSNKGLQECTSTRIEQ